MKKVEWEVLAGNPATVSRKTGPSRRISLRREAGIYLIPPATGRPLWSSSTIPAAGWEPMRAETPGMRESKRTAPNFGRAHEAASCRTRARTLFLAVGTTPRASIEILFARREGTRMKITAHDVFIAMYYALEAAADVLSDHKLKTFVQDCNPFVWKDRGSADPAVYIEFSEAYSHSYGEADISAEESRSFCRNWLREQSEKYEFYRGPLVEAFDSVATPEDWQEVLTGL